MTVAQSAPETAASVLVDEIAAYLAEHGGSPCDQIAAALGRLRTRVLHVLVDDDRFVRTGRGRATRWHLASETGNAADETGYLTTNGAAGTPQSSAPRWSWDRPSSWCCSDPLVHRGNKTFYRDAIAGVELCIRCDGPPVAPPLTFEQWFAGEGGEDRRARFESDWDAVLEKTATPEQIERFRWAIGATDEAVNAVAGVM